MRFVKSRRSGSRNHRLELMAPAGNLDAGYAALHFGADAVYLGLKQFSARADAENFSLEELDRLTAYAHSLQPSRRIYVALNTLILQSELNDVIAAIADVADIGVDALIVQDLGVFRVVRRYFPHLRLQASTQMAIHNVEGAVALEELGFHRVTLARELTLDEISEISKAVRIETEFFAHGALCYSYSGLCLMSSLLLGRSGNRGRCAYLCRERFNTSDGNASFIFSMKDLAVPEYITALRDAGVASLKIEGRKKSPLYVAATVHFYRRLIDGQLESEAERKQCEADIQSIFSRPWTGMHLRGHHAGNAVTDPTFVGHRGAPIGIVEKVVTREGRHWLRCKIHRPLERFDGLQLEIEGHDKPYGFSVETLALPGNARSKPKLIFEARAGSVVEIQLPPHHPPLPMGATVYVASSQAVKRRYRFDRPKPGAFRHRRPVDVTLFINATAVTAQAVCEGARAEEHMDVSLRPAKKATHAEQAVREAFERTGNTPFTLRSLQVENPGGYFVPLSMLNELRRKTLFQLEHILQDRRMKRIHQIIAQEAERPMFVKNSAATVTPLKWSVKICDPNTLTLFAVQDETDLEEIVLDISRFRGGDFFNAIESLAERWGRQRLRLGLPLIMRVWERPVIRNRVARLIQAGWSRWEAAHVFNWALLEDVNARDLVADWAVYVTNRAAARQVLEMGARRITASPEDCAENLQSLLAEFGDRLSVILYQDTPLFISENCVLPTPAKARAWPVQADCSNSTQPLRSAHGDRLLLITENCRTWVIGKSALCWSRFMKQLIDAGARHFRVDLSYRNHSPEQAREIWRAVRAGRNVPGTHSGNFERGWM